LEIVASLCGKPEDPTRPSPAARVESSSVGRWSVRSSVG
jgi:hypothetical protein